MRSNDYFAPPREVFYAPSQVSWLKLFWRLKPWLLPFSFTTVFLRPPYTLSAAISVLFVLLLLQIGIYYSRNPKTVRLLSLCTLSQDRLDLSIIDPRNGSVVILDIINLTTIKRAELACYGVTIKPSWWKFWRWSRHLPVEAFHSPQTMVEFAHELERKGVALQRHSIAPLNS